MSTQIPGYQIIKKAGDGGMSTVYLAIQLSVGREVALKVLSPELRNDPNFATRFYQEAGIVGKFSHPNIISIYDVFKHENHFCMAMDYLPGDSCKDKIKKNLLNPLDSLKTLKEITQALQFIHEGNFIHCDIKPDNILFRSNGTAVLTDFGIARELPDTKSSTVSGTPYYMSPEQSQGHKLDMRSDIYSLGIVLYEMLTGRVPFTGKDPIAIAIKHVSSPIPQLPDELHELTPLLTKLMAKRPGARFQNCNEVIHAIDFIETQYLKQQNTELPLKLRLSFAIQKIQSGLKSLSNLRKRIKYSFRHGLILYIADSSTPRENIANLAQDIENAQTAHSHNTVLDMAGLTNDSLAIALETEQAKKLVPAKIMNGLLLVLALLVTIPAATSISSMLSNNYGKPTVIYID